MKLNWIWSARLVAAWGLGAAWCVATPARAQEAHDNVVIVLDASGSMTGRMPGSQVVKMDAAKAALKEVLKNVSPSTRVGLLVFSARNLTNDWAYPLGPRDDAALLKAIDLPVPSSGTPLGRYIKKGADRLIEERAKQFGYGTFRLLIVTDGEAEDRALVDQYTPDIVGRGITVDVIGVAMAGTHTLARKVHSYRAANDPASLRRALSEVFAEVGDSRTDNTDADVFALLAPIPAEVATAAIQSLSSMDNRPIGTPAAPKPKPATPQPAAPQRATPQPVPPAPPPPNNVSRPAPMVGQVTPPAAANPVHTPSRHRSKSTSGTFIVLGIVIALLVARRLARRS